MNDEQQEIQKNVFMKPERQNHGCISSIDSEEDVGIEIIKYG